MRAERIKQNSKWKIAMPRANPVEYTTSSVDVHQISYVKWIIEIEVRELCGGHGGHGSCAAVLARIFLHSLHNIFVVHARHVGVVILTGGDVNVILG